MDRIENKFFGLLTPLAILILLAIFISVFYVNDIYKTYSPESLEIARFIMSFGIVVSGSISLFKIKVIYARHLVEQENAKVLQGIEDYAELLRKNKNLEQQLDEQIKIINFLMIMNSTDEIPFMLKKYIDKIEDKNEKAKAKEMLNMGAASLTLASCYLDAKDLMINLKLRILTKIDQALISENELAAVFQKLLEISFEHLKELPEENRELSFIIGETKNTYVFRVLSAYIDEAVFNNAELREMIEEINGKTVIGKYGFEITVGKADRKGRPLLYIVGGKHDS